MMVKQEMIFGPFQGTLFIVITLNSELKPISCKFCKSTGSTNEWFRTLQGARPLER